MMRYSADKYMRKRGILRIRVEKTVWVDYNAKGSGFQRNADK